MINRVVIVGRLTKDVDLRQTGTGISVASFTVAANRTFANQSGEREADFIPCVAWRKQAENMAQYVGKGSLVGVEGRLQTRSYDAADGSKRFVMELVADSVQFLEPRGSSQARQTNNFGSGQQQQNNYGNQNQGGGFQQQQPAQNQNQEVDFSFENDNSFDISDDDLPF